MSEYSNLIDLYGDGIGRVEYVEHMGTDLTIVNAARVSFGKHKEELDDKDKKLIKYLVEHRHTSTFEHNIVTFRFTVPLFVRSQHHRHRTFSFNEISRRYSEENIRFYEPKLFRTQHESNRQASNVENLIDPILNKEDENHPKFGEWIHPITASEALRDHHMECVRLYENLLRAGVCREQARGILPQNLYTEYIGTVDLSNLLKFIDLRTHEGAQWEIQKVAAACLQIATDLWPEAVGAFRNIRK